MVNIRKLIKIATLFICLSQIVLIPAVYAEENVPVTIVDFPVCINYELYNIHRESNKMEYCEYPMLLYKDLVYLPLTYYNCNLIGVTLELKDGQAFINKADFQSPMLYISDQQNEAPDNPLNEQKAPFTVNVNDMVYDDADYPVLFYKDIIYLPLTWTVVHDAMGGGYTFGKEGIANKYYDPEDVLELYTDSYYYFSSGDSAFEITEHSIGANVASGKTYWCKNGVRVYAETELINRIGPNRWNMTIVKDGIKKTVPGFTGHGQKMGPLFTVNGEYIYTVHYTDDYKIWGPCKISIETGEVIYTNQ